MKYVVFGAGRMGRAVAWHLVADSTTDHVVLADIDNNTVSSLIDEFNAAGFGNKVSIHRSSSSRFNDDIMEDTVLANLLMGADVCIATCGYKSYVKLTEACIKAGVGMVDLGGNRDVVIGQKAQNQAAIDAGITIIPDCGLAPGMIGILGMLAFQTLQHRKCSSIDINMRVGGLPMSPGSRDVNPLQYALTWSSDGLINEYEIPADELRNDQLVQSPALSGCENIVIQTPWNKTEFEAFVTGGGSSNLPFILQGKVRNVNYKTIRYRGHCAIMQGFKQLGFFEGDLRKSLTSALDANLQLTDGNDIVIARAGARGVLGNRQPTFIIYEIFCAKDEKRNFTAMAQTTGFSAAIIAQMIANKTIKIKGVVDGEIAVPGDSFIERLRATGIKIQGTQR
jgi:lysine 6-dehydrogenase